jgi:hypothetical protein
MSYRNIDELPLGGLVWIEFVPDADGFADEGTTAVVLLKRGDEARLGIPGPDGKPEEECYEIRAGGNQAGLWSEVGGEGSARISPIIERTSQHKHSCGACGFVETHAVRHGCREPYFWMCDDCDEMLSARSRM